MIRGRRKRLEVQLRVAEARQRDIGRKIARVDSRAIRELGLSPGDLIEIVGKKSTVAIVWPPYKEDDGMGLIRIDGEIRRNAGASVGDYVTVRKARAEPARKIVLAPYETLPFVGDLSRIVRSQLLNLPVMKGDVIVIPVLGMGIELKVTSTSPSNVVIVTENTVIDVSSTPVRRVEEVGGVTYEDIGGLHEELQRIREMVELPLKHPELFRHLGIEPPKGVILWGPPGCGKTLIAKAIANETGAHFTSINGPEIMSKFYGESEARLREIFKEAEENAPAIIFIDELDAIAPKRSEVTGEVEKRVVAQLLALMDGLETRGQVIVIGATNRPNALDPAIRRPGRFDREIEIGIPDRNARREILQIHTRGMPLAEDVDLSKLAEITRGYTGADLAALCREAAMKAIRRILPSIDFSEEKVPPEILDKLIVTMKDFFEAFKEITPTALREIEVEVPNVRWEDIGGLDDVKRQLVEAVEWPLKYPEKFERMGVKPPKGVLLYGPPGCGKTMLAKAIATEAEANFISVKGPEIFNKWVGESEKAVREIFRKARQASPCIVFFDEIESVVTRKDLIEDSSGVSGRVTSQILAEMDGIEELSDVIVIGATNRPDLLDPGILRPGRFDRIIYVPPPDEKSRYQIFKIYTRRMPLAPDVSLKDLAIRTEMYSGADLAALCREAAMIALRRNLEAEYVTRQDFEQALSIIKPSITPQLLKEYERMSELLRYRKEQLMMIG